jgi:hypothetical protein
MATLLWRKCVSNACSEGTLVATEDVVEQVEKDVPPPVVLLLIEVGVTDGHASGSRPWLRVPRQVLAAAALLFDLNLAGDPPAVLEVELARPDRRVQAGLLSKDQCTA